jgi:hypothetical protein
VLSFEAMLFTDWLDFRFELACSIIGNRRARQHQKQRYP